jgi:hypothetical protein
MNMIADRAIEPDLVTTEVEADPEAAVLDVGKWRERRPTLRRAFVDNYLPKHRAEPPRG